MPAEVMAVPEPEIDQLDADLDGATCQICGEEGIEDVLAHKCPPEARPWRDDDLRTDGGESQETGTELCWDHEDCPRDGCDGELQQQDRFNVMCLKCERVFTHQKDDDEHRLIHDCEFVARKPRAMTDGGPGQAGSEQ